jgi:hypothetical protein
LPVGPGLPAVRAGFPGACFADLEDPREDNARHDPLEILVIALGAVLCSAEGCCDMELFGHAKEPFLHQFLRPRHGIPSHDGARRVRSSILEAATPRSRG